MGIVRCTQTFQIGGKNLPDGRKEFFVFVVDIFKETSLLVVEVGL